MTESRQRLLSAIAHITLPYVILGLGLGLFQSLPGLNWAVIGSVITFIVAAIPHYLIWVKITDAPKRAKIMASLSVLDARARTAVVFPFYVLGYFAVPIVLLFTGKKALELPGVFQLLFGIRDNLEPNSYVKRILQLLGSYQNSGELAHLLGVELETGGAVDAVYGKDGSTDTYSLFGQEGHYVVAVARAFNFFGLFQVNWGGYFGFMVDSAYSRSDKDDAYLAAPVIAEPASMPFWIKIERHPPLNTLMSTYCSNMDKWGSYADGKGRLIHRLIQADAADCVSANMRAVNSVVPKGTLLRTFCQDYDKWAIKADGTGGTYEQLLQVNHPDCGYVEPTITPVAHHPV